MGAVEYKMPQVFNINDIENCWPRWQRFKQSFRIFLLAAGFENLSEVRKAAILLNCIGHEAQELYFNILKNDEKCKLEDLLNIFDEYFKPKQNEVINSFNFNKRNQEDGETFDEFYSSLRKLSENCNFDVQKDRMLRDRIVIGVRDRRSQQKLLEVKDLTLERAVDICRSAELSNEHVKMLSKEEVHAVQSTSQRRSPVIKAKYKIDNSFTSYNKQGLQSDKNNNGNNKKEIQKKLYTCKKCGTEHGPKSCPAYGQKCRICNKFNHFSLKCTFKNNKKL